MNCFNNRVAPTGPFAVLSKGGGMMGILLGYDATW